MNIILINLKNNKATSSIYAIIKNRFKYVDILTDKNLSLDSLARSYFYSDSMNDLPLLEKVSHPVATNPDDRLRKEAQMRDWPILELFA